MEPNNKKIGLLTVVILAMIFICTGGAFLYKHNKDPLEKRNPIYFSLGIAFAGAGGSIISGIAQAVLVPPHIRSHINEIKFKGKIL